MGSSKEYIEKLRKSGLSPTKQRINICEALFDAEETFHFTIEKLKQIAERESKKKIQHF